MSPFCHGHSWHTCLRCLWHCCYNTKSRRGRVLLRQILRQLVYAIHPLSCWIPEAEWQCGQDHLWIQNAERGPLAHYRPRSCGYWQRRPGIWRRNRASLFHVTEAQIHRQRAQPSMTTPAGTRIAIRDHHLSQELCLFEVDPETLEVTADPASALYIRSEVPGLLILRNIYFTYSPQV